MSVRMPTIEKFKTMETVQDGIENLQEALVVMDNGMDLTGRKVADIVKFMDDDMDTNEYLKPTMGFNVNLNKNQ